MKTSSCGFSSLAALSRRNGKASPSPSEPGVLNIGSFSIEGSVLRGDAECSVLDLFSGDSTAMSGALRNSNS